MEPGRALAEASHLKKIFFPECDNREMAFINDCLAKTINQALGTLFFSQREQLVRMIEQFQKYNSNQAGAVKERREIPIQLLMEPFAISANTAYSLKMLKSFNKKRIELRDERKGVKTDIGKLIIE